MSLRDRGLWMAPVAIAGVLLANWAPAAPVDVIRQCAADASVNLSGLDKLAAACPDLESAIISTGLDRVLPAQWRAQLTGAQLRDLAELATRYSGEAEHIAPGASSLNGILRGLKPEVHESKTWWGALKDWWREWLARSDSALAKWLREISGRVRVSAGVLNWAAYCLAAIIALGAVILGVREFRQWQERRRTAGAEKQSADVEAAVMATLDLPGQANSAEQHLSSVLRALVQRLLETGRLRSERSLTHRELASHSRFDDEQQRHAFAGVTAVAEAAVYGPQGISKAAIPQAIEQGEALLSQIRAVPQ